MEALGVGLREELVSGCEVALEVCNTSYLKFILVLEHTYTHIYI